MSSSIALESRDGGPQDPPAKMSRKKMALWIAGAVIVTAAFFMLSMFVWNDDASIKAALTDFLEQARGTPWALPLVMAAYVGAGFVFFPITLLNLVVAIVFGYWGILYGLIGVMTNTAVFYGIGMLVKKYGGKNWIEHPKVKPVDQKLKKSGLAGMVAIHALPAPPFSILNIIAGISSISAFIYLLGTFLAMLPGAIARGVVGESLSQIILNPTPESYAYLAGGIVLWVVLVGGAHKILKHYQKQEEPNQAA